MKNIDKKRNVYRKRNIIMIFVMHILLSSFLVGCENKSSMWFYKTSETAYYVNKDGKRVSRIYYLEYEDPDYTFDIRGFSKIEKSIRITNPFGSDRFVGDEVYFIDKNFNVVGNRYFKYGKAEKYYYNGQDIFVALTENGIEFFDEEMNSISSIPYSWTEEDRIIWIMDAPGDNGLFPILDKRNGKWGYMNFSGEMVIQSKYDVVEPFFEGKAFVKESYEGNYSIINEKGEILETDVSKERFDSWYENKCEEENTLSSGTGVYELIYKD